MSDLEQRVERIEKRNAELEATIVATLEWIKDHQNEVINQLDSWAKNYEAGIKRSVQQRLRSTR